MSTVRLPIGHFGSSFAQQRDPPRVPPFTFLRLNQGDQIYVSSSSAISIDSPFDSDSGIYNNSTDCSSYSGIGGSGVSKPRAWEVSLRTTHADESQNICAYDWQDVSLWVDVENEEKEETYETIYDIIENGAASDSDFDDVSDLSLDSQVAEPRDRKKNLNKMASAAGRKIRKLRRNWSLKKSDLTRSFSKIRLANQSSSPQFYVEGFSEKPSGDSMFLSSAFKQEIEVFLTGLDNTSFTVTLSVDMPDLLAENPGQAPGEGHTPRRKSSNHFMRAASEPPRKIDNNIDDSDNVYMTMSGICPDLPTRPNRRKSRRNTQVIRPNVPPPRPPVPPLPNTPPPLPITTQPLPNTTPPPLPTNTSPPLPTSEPPSSPIFRISSLPNFEGNLPTLSSAKTILESSYANEPTFEGSYAHALLSSEPLYQFYDSGGYVTKSAQQEHTYESVFYSDLNEASHVDGPRETSGTHVSHPATSTKQKTPAESRKPGRRRTALDMLNSFGKRTLWSELQEVSESGVLEKMSDNDRKLQEAKFEILTSEASYLKSLHVLTSHFLTNLTGSASERDIATLFSHVHAVQSCSEKFLSELDTSWRESYLLHGALRILLDHARRDFHVYIKYCSNQIHQEKILKKLMSENSHFVEVLKDLESSQVCQNLSLHSFLMLPMQRVTRLPLLVAAITSRLHSSSPLFPLARDCMNVLNKLAEECNEGARSVHRMEELIVISKLLDFRDLRAIALVSSSRWLVRQTEAVRIQWKESTESVRLTFGKRNNKQTLVLYLFTDLLVISKKKSDVHYAVIDYCARNLVQVSSLNKEDSPIPGLPEHNCYPVWLTLLQNNENKTQEMLVYFPSAAERDKWMNLLNSTPIQEVDEVVFPDWDAPLVEIAAPFSVGENIVFQPGETLRVARKKAGLLLVEKSGTKEQFWIQQEITREVLSDHLRAKNFKQRYNFLQSITDNSS